MTERKHPGGRPPADDPRAARINVSFTADEATELKRARGGVPLAVFVRDAALRWVRFATPPAYPIVAPETEDYAPADPAWSEDEEEGEG